VRAHRVYFRDGLYTDQVAASAAAARLYAERAVPKTWSVRQDRVHDGVDGFRRHVDPKLDRSFINRAGERWGRPPIPGESVCRFHVGAAPVK
jgi:hypothetical protein